jgi:peptide/nickel transport system substrate-binding protein
MIHSIRWSIHLVTLVVGAAIILAGCGGETIQTVSSEPTPTPTVTETPFTPLAYPETGEAPCGVAPYTGNFKKITAVDRYTVEFDLCAPDAAFIPKIAFSVFAIQDTDTLNTKMADQSILTTANGTGPYMLKQWDHGSRMLFEANPNYWGTKALTPNLEFRWSDQAAQRLQELQAGTVDGIDNPGAADIATIEGDSTLKFYPREGLDIFYLGFNDQIAPWNNDKVRLAIAKGIDRQRIVDNFYPAGSVVATHFTPCAIPFGCAGDDWYDFNPAEAKQLLADAGFPDGFKTKLQFRAAVRGYLPDPPAVATEIQQQLKDNLNIDAELDLQESGTFLDNNVAGKLDGIFMLGGGADYPDVTNFLDYHFGAGSGAKFGEPWDDIVAALNEGGTSVSDADREAAYTEANNLIKQHVPMVPIAHGASGTAFQADVERAYASPLGSEVFSVMKAADRDTLIWMQNAEPLSTYCGDESDGETLRACEQVFESLYGYEIGGITAVPALATECTPNGDLTVWRCKLRESVKFHNGADLDANDVVLSFALQWDAANPLHVGRTGAFEYFAGLFGGFLNPPPAS